MSIETILTANEQVIFADRPQLYSLIKRVNDRVRQSDQGLADAQHQLRLAKTGLYKKRLIISALNSTHANLVNEALYESIILPSTSKNDSSSSIKTLRDVQSHVQQLSDQIREYLGLQPGKSISREVERLQARLTKTQEQSVDKTAAIHSMLSIMHDILRKTIDISTELLIVHKLQRQRCMDETLVEILKQRAITFELKLQAMTGRILEDTYTQSSLDALKCIKDILDRDISQKQSEVLLVRNQVAQYEGISEFGAIVKEYAELRKNIAIQKELITQFDACST
uniref:Uncharacterized protein n=1 Tax=Spongospora subterranea TaxID=70186 RepID=A0A0H5RMM2_9EUKA|eukprot:CRZ09969.1 hypothetical protein [Spongospora subterranea]